MVGLHCCKRRFVTLHCQKQRLLLLHCQSGSGHQHQAPARQLTAPSTGIPAPAPNPLSPLDLCIVRSLYGLYMCKHFWPCPAMSAAELGPGGTIRWPRQSHPRALTPAGQERTPWLTSWARATFEQGILSVLPTLEGPCTATSLPGEHLFQASATSHIPCLR